MVARKHTESSTGPKNELDYTHGTARGYVASGMQTSATVRHRLHHGNDDFDTEVWKAWTSNLQIGKDM